MDAITIQFISTITELVFKYGVPAVINIIKTWQIDGEPTLEDLFVLKNKVPLPDSA